MLPHISGAWETNKFVSCMVRGREMVVLDDLGNLAVTAELGFRSVDDDGWVIVAVDLTAFDLLEPAVRDDSSHCGTFGGIRVQHCEENAAECRWVDVVIEEADVGVIGFCDVG